jgi:GNAT superfamily N-acetyltransferase
VSPAGDATRSGIQVVGPLTSRGALCEELLRGLPDWFGIEASIVEYRRTVEELPTFVAEFDGEAAGLLALTPTSPAALELHVVAVRREHHRRGIGRALVERAATYAREEGFSLLHVKTLGPEIEDEGYAGTRAFYEAVGFMPLEVIPAVWGPENPCLIMVRVL